MRCDPNFKENIKLYDILDRLDRALVINRKVKEIFTREGIIGEFLQVKIWDHDNALVYLVITISLII